MQKVVGLQEHVIELDKVKTLFEANLVAFGSQHLVNAEMPPDIAQEFDVVNFCQPVGIIEEQRFAVGKFEILGKLLPRHCAL